MIVSTFGRGLDLNPTVVINWEYRMNHWATQQQQERETLGFLIENARRPQVDTGCEVIGINNPIYSPSAWFHRFSIIPTILIRLTVNEEERESERGISLPLLLSLLSSFVRLVFRVAHARMIDLVRDLRAKRNLLSRSAGSKLMAANHRPRDLSIPIHRSVLDRRFRYTSRWFSGISPSLSFSRRVPSSRYHFGIRRIDSMLIVRRLLRLLDVSTAETMRLRWRERVHTGFRIHLSTDRTSSDCESRNRRNCSSAIIRRFSRISPAARAIIINRN